MALANIATATQAYRTLVALLKKTIVELSTQVTTLTLKLVTAQSDNARLKRSGHRLAPAIHGHRSANVGSPSDQNPFRDRNSYSRSGEIFDPNRYCSSHGFKVKESHTSATCQYLVDGHNKLAMRLDTKGGKTWNRDWINDRPIK